jgi:hypothetical protein
LDANGNVHIVVSWNGNGTTPNPTGDHVFEATITGNAGSFHIDGQVTVAGGGGPGHVVGDQTP